jgi:hypothetical protein
MRHARLWPFVIIASILSGYFAANMPVNADTVTWSRSQAAVVLDAKDFVAISGRVFNVGELINQHEELWRVHVKNKQRK